MSLPILYFSDQKRELNFCNGYLSLLYFCEPTILLFFFWLTFFWRLWGMSWNKLHFLQGIQVSKSQKHFFSWNFIASKVTYVNFWQISALVYKMGQIKNIFIWPSLEARAEICQRFRSLFGQWSFKNNCFWDLLTFKYSQFFSFA